MKRMTMAACILLAGVGLCAEILATYARQAAAAPTSSTPSPAPSVRKKKKRHARHEPKQMAPTPDRIEEIQSALASNGYYQGTPNGKWDSTTVAAMQKFQGDHGLDATGKLDALSLQKLGLGSEIAGVSAPRPIKPAAPNPAPAGVVPATPQPQTPSTPNAPTGPPSAAASAATVKPSAPAAKLPAPPQPQ
jgi:peptidoglycan hydrolase-like protein with peptidoglycan-binding domain